MYLPRCVDLGGREYMKRKEKKKDHSRFKI